MEPYGTRICPGVFWKGFKQAYIICLSKSVVFPSNKVELCHLNSSFSCKKCRFSADFVEVFSFGPDAFVAAPQAVETRALQLLGCVQVKWNVNSIVTRKYDGRSIAHGPCWPTWPQGLITPRANDSILERSHQSWRPAAGCAKVYPMKSQERTMKIKRIDRSLYDD